MILPLSPVTAEVNTCYIRFQALKPNSGISSLLIVMGKPIRNPYPGTVKHDWTSIFASEPIGSLFYLHMVIFENPKWYFIIKPPAC